MDLLKAAAAWGTVALAIGLLYRPLGDYMAWVFTSRRHTKFENLIYKAIGVNPDAEQTWQAYLRGVLAFSGVGLVMLFLLQVFQHWLPWSLGLPGVRWDTAFNTAASFVGNTNWQSYVPETTMGYTVQMAGLTVQSFVCAAVGIAVSVALVRGISRHRSKTLGNFWCDVVRANLRILLPMSIIAAIILMSGGVVQNLAGFTHITTIDGGGGVIPGGPVASQESIKMLGTNGGGFFNGNSAHPFENPTPWTNMFQVFMLLIIPFTLCRTFGKMVKDQRLGYTILATMVVLFTTAYVAITAAELSAGGTAMQLAGGSMEGKEQRFGIFGSTLFATATTGTSGGASNSMHGSYTAVGAMVEIMHMSLGELSPGGVGAGLYTMLVLVIIGVFLTAHLLGRTPVFLGKRVGLTEMKLASVFILVMPVLAMGGMALTMAIPSVHAEVVNKAMSEPGPQGLTEFVYAFISCAINNGSSMAGFSANTVWLNVTLGIIILAGRFVVIGLVLVLAASLGEQDRVPVQMDVLPLGKPQFVGLLTGIIVVCALPQFFAILLPASLAEVFHP